MHKIQYRIKDYKFFLAQDKFGQYYITSVADHSEILKFTRHDDAMKKAEFIADAKKTDTYTNFLIVKNGNKII